MPVPTPPLVVAGDDSEGSTVGTTPPSAFARFPPRPVASHWPATAACRAEVVQLVTAAMAALPDGARLCRNRRRGLPLLLDWLEEQPGQSWQQRWLASGADAAGDDWAQGPRQWLARSCRLSTARLELMTSSLL